MSTTTTADEYKEKGNAAFAAQNFDVAIECYTKAIQINNKNHVFYSNRSASYGGKEEWKKAVDDAKECIRLNPSFLKGYYRLATAQLELAEYDLATATIKQGLNIDPENSQLLRLLKTSKQKKAASTRSSNTLSTTSAAKATLATTTTTASGKDNEELMDLQNQLRQSVRDYNIVNTNMHKIEKESKINEITKSELQPLCANPDTNMYRGIGKMFLKCPSSGIMEYLETEMVNDQKKLKEFTQKRDYIERRMKSQQQNIMELRGTTASTSA